jgi:hypothetical protein
MNVSFVANIRDIQADFNRRTGHHKVVP